MFKKYLKQLSLPESYISITLGFLVVIVAGLLLYNYVTKNKGENQTSQEKTFVEKQEEKATLPTTHTVTENETLWSIAEKYYASGYNWVSIAKENNLANPDKLMIGQALTIPNVEVIKLDTGTTLSTATGKTATVIVARGDSLWDIAVREYGDGYAWVKIAQANNLVNPDVIHAGNVFTLPR